DDVREDGGVVQEDQDGASVLYQRPAWTQWQIEVRAYPDGPSFAEVDAVFRTGWRDGRECEMFTLMLARRDFTLVALDLFKTIVRVYAYVPAEVLIHQAKKRVVIHLLCHVQVVDEKIRVSPLG
ncbi:MAG: hypothetical protein KKB13_21160, partial [Chloroflexi bacterium]|nr:hypothetical protein [Chloroflexota bacterium]